MSAPASNFDLIVTRAGAKNNETASFLKNQVIFSQGERSDSLFYIEKGTVKLTVTSRSGKEGVLSILDGGAFFGEGCVAAGPSARPYNAVAITDTRLLRCTDNSVSLSVL